MADKDLVYRLVIKDDGTPVLRKVAADAEQVGAQVTAAQAKASAESLRSQIKSAEEGVRAAKKSEQAARDAASVQIQSLREAEKVARESSRESITAARDAEKIRVTAEKSVAGAAKESALAQSQIASDIAKNTKEVASSASARVALEKEANTVAQTELKNAKATREEAQAKYRDLKDQESAIKSQMATIVQSQKAQEKAAKDAEKASKDAARATKQQTEETSSLGRTMERIQRTVAAFVAVWAFQKITSGISDIIKGGLEFNAVIEESRLGMASIFMAQGNFIDSSGKAQVGTEALNSAMIMSSEISKKLQLDNLRTAATYQQLVKAYQQTIAPGLAVGFDPEQIRKYTVGMVQAASALGLNLDMLAEETRSMLKGTITPRNTLIATALGIRNEDINRYKGDIDGLYKYVMSRLSAFGTAGEAVQMTWKGAMSNVKDVIQMTLGEGFTNLFDYLKREAVNIQNKLVKWDIGGPKIDAEIVGILKSSGEAIIEIIEGTKKWVGSLAGLLPVLGTVYQVLRLVGIILTPIIEGFGRILSLVGMMASMITEVLKPINNLISSTHIFQTAAVIAVSVWLLGLPKIGILVSALTSSWAMWLIPLSAVLALFNELDGSLSKTPEQIAVVRFGIAAIGAAFMAATGPVGVFLGMLTLIVEGVRAIATADPITKWSKGMEDIVGAEYGIDVEVKLAPDTKTIIQGQLESISQDINTSPMLKIRAQIADDSKKELDNWFNDAMKKATKVEKILGAPSAQEYTSNPLSGFGGTGGAITYAPRPPQLDQAQMDTILKVRTTLGEIGDQELENIQILRSGFPSYKELKSYTDQELVAIAKIANEWKKAGLPPEWKDLFNRLADQSKKLSEISISNTIEEISMQIATQNKDYWEQIRLINLLNKNKMDTLKLEGKLTNEVEKAMKAGTAQKVKEVTITKTTEQQGWEEQLNKEKAAQAGILGDIEKQINADRGALEVEIERSHVGLGLRDALQEQADNAKKLTFEMGAVVKIAKDRYDWESKTISLRQDISTTIGDYQAQVVYLKEAYRIKYETMAIENAGKLGRVNELSTAEGLLVAYKGKQIILEGEYNLTKQISDVETELAALRQGDAVAMNVKLVAAQKYAEFLKQELANKVQLGIDTGKPMDPAIIAQMEKLISLTKELGKASITEKSLEDQVNFYSTIENRATQWYDKQLELIKRNQAANTIYYGKEAADAMAAQDIRKAKIDLFDKENKSINDTITNTEKMFDTASALYSKDSKQYKLLQEGKKVAQIAELAMEIRKNAVIVAGYFAKSTAAATAGATEVAANTASAVTGATAAIATQGSGDPYTAFARVAAMIALMGSVLAMGGIAFGGGGGGGGASSAPVLPPSTVLGGETGQGSASVSNSIKILEDIYSIEYRELTGIHDSMKELNRNILGLVTSIVRTGTIGGAMGGMIGKTTGIGSTWGTNTVGFLNTLTGLNSGSKDFNSFVMSPLLEKIMGWLGGLGNSVMNKIMGGGTSSNLASAGIQFGGSSVSGLLAGGSMGGRQYADITTEHKGGWFHKDWTSMETRYAALDQNVSNMLDSVFKDLGSTLVELAKGMGTDTQAALDYVFASTKIDLHGKSTEDINKAISEFISNMADKAVESLFGSMLRGYQQLNEGLFETATRLMRDKEVILETLRMTGQAFTGTVPQIIAFSEAIIDMAGGLDKLQETAGTYYDKFFTDAEKQTRLQKQLSAAMSDMGMSLPSTRAGYRTLVEGLDLATEAGQKAYIALLSMAEGADKYYTVVDEITNTTRKLIDGLKDRVEYITSWIARMNTSSTAVVGSARAWQIEYDRQKGMASAVGASDTTVSNFLSYAKSYLDFQQKFTGGNYLDIYNSVLADVKAIGDAASAQIPIAERQLMATQSAAAAQLAATQETNAILQSIAPSAWPPEKLPVHAAGGLSSGPSIFGEAGPEWAVPTYEPQRSRFLRDVGASPDAIGRALAKYIGNTPAIGAGGGDITIKLIIDGKEITGVIVRGIRSGDPELIKHLKKAVA